MYPLDGHFGGHTAGVLGENPVRARPGSGFPSAARRQLDLLKRKHPPTYRSISINLVIVSFVDEECW